MVRARVPLSRIVLLIVLALPIGAAGCTSDPMSPTTTPAFSQTDLRVGTGDGVAAGATLTVNYTGWLYDASRPNQEGIQFDSSIGATPFSFTLGSGQVIQGWDQGIVGMKVG